MMKRIHLRAGIRKLGSALHAHGKEIAYYAGVALALTALAFAAESWRGGHEGEANAPVLPASEFAAPTDSAGAAGEAESAPALPEGAELLRGYAADPAWNAALGQWECHTATDYRLPGDVAICLCSGTVRAVERGGALGGFVEVDSGGFVLRYGSIIPRENLRPGDAVEAGEALGAAGDSMPGESALGPHLHLECIEGGKTVDFAARAISSGGAGGD